MASLISVAEQSGILSVFSSSFDTFARNVIVYKSPIKVEAVVSPSTTNNTFGFGEIQQDPAYTYLPATTGVFMAIIKDNDIGNTPGVQGGLSPEIMARIIASPMSLKVKRDAKNFIDDGPTDKIVDTMSDKIYLLNGHGCLQTFVGSEYYVYPLKESD